MYVSTANGGLPPNPTKKLSNDANGRSNNVITFSGKRKGVFQWRVDCIEEGTGKIRKGDVWTFTIDR